MILDMAATEIEAFLAEQVVGRVGCHVAGTTYVVPLIYTWHEGCAYVYSVEGQKVSMMRENPIVCFEVDQYLPGTGWRSVIVQGTFEELEGEEASRTLRLLSERFGPRPGPTGPGGDESGAAPGSPAPRGEGRTPVAFRIRAAEVTGRKVERGQATPATSDA